MIILPTAKAHYVEDFWHLTNCIRYSATRKVLPWHLQQAEEMQLFGGKSHILLFMRASGSELLMLGSLGESDTLGSFFGQGH